jgi:hypothetical protein
MKANVAELLLSAWKMEPSIVSGRTRPYWPPVDTGEPTFHARLHTLALATETQWLPAQASRYRIWNLFNFIPLVFMVAAA